MLSALSVFLAGTLTDLFVTVEAVGERVVVVVRGAVFAAAPFPLVLSALSVFLAGALTDLFVTVGAVVVVATDGFVVDGLFAATLGLLRLALGAAGVGGFGTFFSAGFLGTVAGFVVVVVIEVVVVVVVAAAAAAAVVVFGKGFAIGFDADGVTLDTVGLVVAVVVFPAIGLVQGVDFCVLSGDGFFSAGFIVVLADGVVLDGVALVGVARPGGTFPDFSSAALLGGFVDTAGDLAVSASGFLTSS